MGWRRNLAALSYFWVWVAYICNTLTRSVDFESSNSSDTLTIDGYEPSDRRPIRAADYRFGVGPRVKASEQDIILMLLNTTHYDWRVRPRGGNDSINIDTGGPVVVTVNIYLRSISKIDDVNMEYSAQFTFREQWRDPRLAYHSRINELAPHKRYDDENLPKFVVLATSDQGTDQQIWMPDTFFQNEKEARRHLIDKPNVLIRIYPNGDILYSVRLSLVLSCPMFLNFYPLDHQICKIEMGSYAYTTDDIVYEWKNINPVQLKTGLEKSLPSFELQNVSVDYCTSKTNTGEYSCLQTNLILRREFSYYLLQLYIPSFMLVIVSWVSFWLDKDSVPARVTLGVTTLLTMTTQSSGINAKLPPVSYTKAIDVWIGVCLAFIFGALLEFALVNYAARKDMMLESRGRNAQRSVQPVSNADTSNQGYTSTPQQTPVQARGRVPPDPYMEQVPQMTDPHNSYPNNGLINSQSLSYGGSQSPAPQLQQQHSVGPNQYHPALVPPVMQGSARAQAQANAQQYLPPGALTAGTGYGASVMYRGQHSQAAAHTQGQAQSVSQQHQSVYQNSPPMSAGHQAQAPMAYGADVASCGQVAGVSSPLMPPAPSSHSRHTSKPLLQRRGGLFSIFFNKYKERAKRIDVISRVMFPTGFFVFNIIYWLYYLIPSKDTGQDDQPN